MQNKESLCTEYGDPGDEKDAKPMTAYEYNLRRFVRDGGMVDMNAPIPDTTA